MPSALTVSNNIDGTGVVSNLISGAELGRIAGPGDLDLDGIAGNHAVIQDNNPDNATYWEFSNTIVAVISQNSMRNTTHEVKKLNQDNPSSPVVLIGFSCFPVVMVAPVAFTSMVLHSSVCGPTMTWPA